MNIARTPSTTTAAAAGKTVAKRRMRGPLGTLEAMSLQAVTRLVTRGTIPAKDLMSSLPPEVALKVMGRVPLSWRSIEGYMELARQLEDEAMFLRGLAFVKLSFKGLQVMLGDERLEAMVGPEILGDIKEEQEQLDYFTSKLKNSGKVIERAEPLRATQPLPQAISEDGNLGGDVIISFSYAELMNGVLWDARVDPARREQYLPPDEFAQILGCSKDEFGALPAWKQHIMKVERGLF